MFVGLLNYPERDQYNLTSLRFAVSAAAPLAPETQDQFQAVTGSTMLQAYGLTETSPCATAEPVDRPKPHSIGLPLPDTDLKIVDADTGTQELGPGEIGEIIIKGPQVMKGYWNRPEETAKVLTADGALRTGDMGRMDESGYTYITDRKKDMILVSGFNVYPNEIEAVVAEVDGVLEAAAVGVPDDKSGEAVKLYVVRTRPSVTADDIIAHCRENLTRYKLPREVEFRDELPKTNVGKILRRALRDEALDRSASANS